MEKFTEKDLAYITDMYSWNENALLVANHFLGHLEECKDQGAEDAKELMEEIVGMHYENLNKCIAILKGCHVEYDEECDSEDCTYDEEDEDDEEEEEDNE